MLGLLWSFFGKVIRSRWSLITVAAISAACNSGGFTGGGKKKVNAPAPAPQPRLPPPVPQVQPDIPPPDVDPRLGNSVPVVPAPQPLPRPPRPTVVPIAPAPLPVPVPTQTPIPQVTPPPAPLPAPPPGEQEVGNLRVSAALFVNMEHQSHATEPGSWAILRSGSQVVAAGPMLVEAACRGDNLDSMGYPVVRLNIGLKYLARQAQSGQGTLSICLVQNPQASADALTCERVDRGNDGERPAFWYDEPVSFTISGNQVAIEDGGGSVVSDGFGESSNGFSDGSSQSSGDQFVGGDPSISDPAVQGGDGEGFGLAGANAKKGKSRPTMDPFDAERSKGKKRGSLGLRGARRGGGRRALSFAHPIQAGQCGSRSRAWADYNSPLVLDLSGTGTYDLINVWDGKKRVAFDIEGKGEMIRTGWAGPKAGLLVLDVNGNGKIDNGSELFGEFSASLTPVEKGSVTNFKNGFQALAQYDANEDGQIDDKDPIFARLQVWVDKNSDGVAQQGELLSMAEAKIKALSLAYTKTSGTRQYFMVQMNEVRLESSFKTTDGKVQKLGDVWFAARRQDVSSITSKGASK